MRRSTPKVAGRSKYNVRTDAVGKANRTVDNILFDSLKEAKRYQDLKLLERAGVIVKLEADKKKLRWPLKVNGELICTYVADFGYREPDAARYVIEDAKGMKTAVYRLKKKLMKAIHGIEIREI